MSYMRNYKYLYASWKSLDFERIKRLVKEGGWVISGQVASVLGALVLVRVLTEYLDPAEYGLLALGLTIAGLVNQVVMGGLAATIGRFYSIAIEKADLYGYLQASKVLTGYAASVLTVFFFLGMFYFILSEQGELLGMAAAVLVFSILSGFNSSLSSLQNAARQRSVVALHSGLDAWLKIGFSFLAIHWIESSFCSVMIGFSLSSLIVICSQFYFLNRILPKIKYSNSFQYKQVWVRDMLNFAWPFSLWGVFTWLQQSSDRWILNLLTSAEEVGQYAVVFQLGYAPIGIMTGMMVSFVGPILYARSGAANEKSRIESVHYLAWRITGASLVMTGVVFLIGLLSHEWLFQILVAKPFQISSYLFPWTILAGGLFAAGQMLALKLMSELKVRVMIGVKICTAVIGILCNWIGVLLLGLPGIVVGLVVFSFCYFLWMTCISLNVQRVGGLESSKVVLGE